MFSYEVKFLTNEEAIYIKSSDFKSYKYETKKKNDETVYDTSKKNFSERRGGYNTPPRPRQLRQLETKLRDKNIIACKWLCDSYLTLVFSSGVLAHVTVKPNCLDVSHILFDKYCVGKLVGQTMTGVALSKTAILFISTEKTATLFTFGKTVDSNRPCLLSEREPCIQLIELGGSARRVDRHISSFDHSNGLNVLVWGSTTSEPAPWSPIIEDHANLHLYQITGQQFTLITYHQLENEVILAELSQKYENVVHIVEQIACQKNGVTLIWLRYEVPQGSVQVKLSGLTESANRICMQAPVRVAHRSACDTKLLAACIDGSIHVVHHSVGITHSTRAGFIATDVRWAGEMIVAAEESGRLQCFDRALASLHQHTKFIDLTTYLRDSRRIQILATHKTRNGTLILATFTGGPLTLLRIIHPRLTTAWIRSGRLANAVALLRALDWEDSADCVRSIDEVFRAAMRAGGSAGEGAAQAALGAYLAPAAPLPRASHAHARTMHDRARTFYHHLLRRGRIEKALSLGVELSAWDLFVDARWAATRRGLGELAREAAEYARMYASDSECSDSCSQCSSHLYTGSEDESSSSSKIKTNPPPLPRVPVPPQASILTVPIIPHEPHSTHSIRPNLHQYLERDNTIWAKDAREKAIGLKVARDNTLWTNDAGGNTIWTKDARDNATWLKDARDNAAWLKDARDNAAWAIDQRNNVIGTNETRDNTIWPKDSRNNTTWTTNVRDDSYLAKMYAQNHFKPLQNQNLRWNSLDNVLSVRQRPRNPTLEDVHSKLELIQREDRIGPNQYKHVFQSELKEELPSRERVQPVNVNFNGRYRQDNTSWPVRERERNKVKFSETVTVAVVPESPSSGPDVAQELADSLPLCAPHKYLAAFAPAPAPVPPGTTLDYVEV